MHRRVRRLTGWGQESTGTSHSVLEGKREKPNGRKKQEPTLFRRKWDHGTWGGGGERFFTENM